MKLSGSLIGIAICSTTAHAAPVFPPDDDWTPLVCGGAPMTDRLGDEAGALDDRDLVGDFRAPAGFHASDGELLYLRLRLDREPALAGSGWGAAFDLDANPATYELLIVADGIGGPGEIGVYRNTTTTVANSPRDPADLPAAAVFPFDANGRVHVASRSRYGGNDDYFLDLAVPWSALAPLGLDRGTRASLWLGSSSTATNLDGDLACHDGRSGPPALDGAASDPTSPDPTLDTDGDGFTDAEEIEAGSDPTDPDSIPPSRLEGGGGCTTTGGATLAPALLVLLACTRRRRHFSRCDRSR